ncbi:Helicase associated domain protein [Streptomyces sp. NPDC048192]|uniref:helicase associated domain-containing protein n=1 Tax=Streptomyces sp. NPDC048192 TaxID=3365510 RepID=UPI00370FC874
MPTVDSVALIDPKGSAVDIMQAIGRALRQKPHQGKLATLIVPVFLRPDETGEDIPYSDSYRPLIKVLSGLRAHDERAVEMLAIPQEGLHRTPADPSYLGEEPEDGEEEQRVLLRFGTHRDPALIARLVRYNLIEPEHANWKAGHQAAVAFRRRTGHLAVPYEHRELMPGGHSFPLGRWLADQRRSMQAGTLASERAEDLEELGMIWDPSEEAWEENLAAARAYYAETGTLAAPVTATALDKPVGQWLANCRKPDGLGKDEERAKRRAEQLAQIDPDWRPAWPIDWQRNYAALARLLALGAELDEIVPGVTAGGTDVGRWLERQRQHVVWEGLTPGQRQRLTVLGITPLLPQQKPPAPAPRNSSAAFERGCAAPRTVPGANGHGRAGQPHPHRDPPRRQYGPPRGVPLQHQNPASQAEHRATGAAGCARTAMGDPGRGVGVLRGCGPSGNRTPERPAARSGKSHTGLSPRSCRPVP